jgi:hypothetical protein
MQAILISKMLKLKLITLKLITNINIISNVDIKCFENLLLYM